MRDALFHLDPRSRERSLVDPEYRQTPIPGGFLLASFSTEDNKGNERREQPLLRCALLEQEIPEEAEEILVAWYRPGKDE